MPAPKKIRVDYEESQKEGGAENDLDSSSHPCSPSRIVQSFPLTPSSSRFLKMISLVVPGVLSSTPGTRASQSTGPVPSWLDMVQPLDMVDPNDIAKEEVSKRRATKDALINLEPADSMARPRIL